MNLRAYKKIYDELGIVVIPNVFSDSEMAALKQAAYALDPKKIKEAGYPHSPEETAKNKRSLIFFPAIADSYINQIRKDKRLQNIVETFLGKNVKQVNNQIYFRERGDTDEFAWHQDIVFREPRDRFPDVEKHYLQTIIAVDDLKEDNGAIEFIERSHLEGDQYLQTRHALTKMLRTFERKGLKGIKYTAPKGSILLWNVLAVHGSEANVSDGDRMTYMNGFCRAEGCLDYPWYLKDGKVQEIDPKLIP